MRYGYCRPCHSDYQRVHKLARVFNITPEEYDRLLESQGGVCAICKRPPKRNRLAVDHDHKTRLVRGLICESCNHGLGFWGDEVERFAAAASYLTAPPAVYVIGERRTVRKKSEKGKKPRGNPRGAYTRNRALAEERNDTT